MIQDIK